MLQTLVAALLAGILSPLILAFLQYRFIWRAQKLREMKKEVFDEAIKTLAMNEVAQFYHHGTDREETVLQQQKANLLVEIFFSRASSVLFSHASTMRFEAVEQGVKVPQGYYDVLDAAVRSMAAELGIIVPASPENKPPIATAAANAAARRGD
jgi:hypothetical protein